MRRYSDTQIGWVKVGGPTALTGALEYLVSEFAEDLFGVGLGRASGVQDEASSVEMYHGSADWILMNPPYSRTRGGQSAFDLTNLTERGSEAMPETMEESGKGRTREFACRNGGIVSCTS